MDWYKGSADAIYQNLNIITDEEPDHIFVFGADHVYRMDCQQMLDFHVSRKAACTVAAIPVPIEEGKEFGIIDMGPDGRMKGFVEKPSNPPPMPGNPKMCLASMGNYLFSTDSLVKEVVRDAADESSAHDFGKSIISQLYKHEPVYVYDFAKNTIAGQEEKERGYWRDVGNIDTYYQSNMDLVEVEPIFNLYNDRWPMYTQPNNLPPAKFVFADRENKRVGHATDSPHPPRHHRQERGDPPGDDHRLRPGRGPAPLPRHLGRRRRHPQGHEGRLSFPRNAGGPDAGCAPGLLKTASRA
jgi:glucose-1-phosphate adenylyltransferase